MHQSKCALCEDPLTPSDQVVVYPFNGRTYVDHNEDTVTYDGKQYHQVCAVAVYKVEQNAKS